MRSSTTSRPCVVLGRPGAEEACIHAHVVRDKKGVEMKKITTTNKRTRDTQRQRRLGSRSAKVRTYAHSRMRAQQEAKAQHS